MALVILPLRFHHPIISLMGLKKKNQDIIGWRWMQTETNENNFLPERAYK